MNCPKCEDHEPMEFALLKVGAHGDAEVYRCEVCDYTWCLETDSELMGPSMSEVDRRCEYQGCSRDAGEAAYSDGGSWGPVYLCSEHAQGLLDVLVTDGERLCWRLNPQLGYHEAEPCEDWEPSS
jgi:hypothetical protein